ncbi:MAG: hypothetical protein JXA74_15065, partial [Anaerolineae bacterium]|nr:hypothetical protein [Anaerolineae bacterium]
MTLPVCLALATLLGMVACEATPTRESLVSPLPSARPLAREVAESSPMPSASPTPRPSPTLDLTEMLRANPMPPRYPDAQALSQGNATRLERCAPVERACVGSAKLFWVADVEAARYDAITATLQVEAEHVQMWVEEGASVDREALARSARVFEERIYPTNRAYFGEEWSPGIDADPRLVVLNVQRMSAAGYFAAANELPCTLNPYSNEHEMFVMELASLTPGTATYESVLAHEFQHMIHWFSDPNEDAWLNEGAS